MPITLTSEALDDIFQDATELPDDWRGQPQSVWSRWTRSFNCGDAISLERGNGEMDFNTNNCVIRYKFERRGEEQAAIVFVNTTAQDVERHRQTTIAALLTAFREIQNTVQSPSRLDDYERGVLDCAFDLRGVGVQWNTRIGQLCVNLDLYRDVISADAPSVQRHMMQDILPPTNVVRVVFTLVNTRSGARARVITTRAAVEADAEDVRNGILQAGYNVLHNNIAGHGTPVPETESSETVETEGATSVEDEEPVADPVAAEEEAGRATTPRAPDRSLDNVWQQIPGLPSWANSFNEPRRIIYDERLMGIRPYVTPRRKFGFIPRTWREDEPTLWGVLQAANISMFESRERDGIIIRPDDMKDLIEFTHGWIIQAHFFAEADLVRHRQQYSWHAHTAAMIDLAPTEILEAIDADGEPVGGISRRIMMVADLGPPLGFSANRYSYRDDTAVGGGDPELLARRAEADQVRHIVNIQNVVRAGRRSGMSGHDWRSTLRTHHAALVHYRDTNSSAHVQQIAGALIDEISGALERSAIEERRAADRTSTRPIIQTPPLRANPSPPDLGEVIRSMTRNVRSPADRARLEAQLQRSLSRLTPEQRIAIGDTNGDDIVNVPQVAMERIARERPAERESTARPPLTPRELGDVIRQAHEASVEHVETVDTPAVDVPNTGQEPPASTE